MPTFPVSHGYERQLARNITEKQQEGDWGRELGGRNPSWVKVDDQGWRGIRSQANGLFSAIRSFVTRQISAHRRRTRRSLFTRNSLTAPANERSTLVFILLCGLWYMTSALSSNTGKAILTQFRYPITLTFVQFGFVALYCLLFMSPLVQFSKLRFPNRQIIRSTLPMGMFQVGGHMFSSIAISRIPVSTVHTIKALSPLFTVTAYALFFGVSYTPKTYLSLLPLTLGVMLACSFDVSASNAVGLLCAFGSALVFVSSNIFFKKIMPSGTGGSTAHSSHKLDKLNLLFYSSGMAFLLMAPIWFYYDLPIFLSGHVDPDHITHPNHGHSTPHSVTYYFFMNGTVHFAQNIIAFVILSSTSPVTYSIASLIKRVAVICIAIVWFNQTVHPVQAFGIAMTFTGLYMYNNAKGDVERGEKQMRKVEAARDFMLPTNKVDLNILNGTDSPPPEQFVPHGAETTGMGLPHVAQSRGRGFSVSSHHISQQAPTFTQHIHPHPPLDLHIKITPPNSPTHRRNTIKSPSVDSYPSPPPSLDSPPSRTIDLGHFPLQDHLGIQGRTGFSDHTPLPSTVVVS